MRNITESIGSCQCAETMWTVMEREIKQMGMHNDTPSADFASRPPPLPVPTTYI